MTNVGGELPSDPQKLMAIIRQQRAELLRRGAKLAQRDSELVQCNSELAQRESALEHCDLHIEQLRQESTAALAAIAQRDQELSRQRDELARHEAELAARAAAIEQIKREAADQIEAERQRHKAEMDALLRRFYGPRSERFDPTQLFLFGLLVDQMPINEKAIEQEAGEKLVSRRARHKHGRSKLPDHLPRQIIEHDLTDEEKRCSCCGEVRERIGSESSEQLEYVPSSLKVLEHVRHKYACKHCGEHCDKCDGNPQIDLAQKPVQPIEKGLAGPGLLAYVAVSKHADHLPLYRLEQIFARQDVSIARSTMCGWMGSIATLLTPLYERLIERVKQSKVIHTDETVVPVQDANRRGPCKKGRIWTYLGDEGNPYVIYDYTPDRTRAGPQQFLAGYKGYLQADAYGGYDGIYATGVVEVACWAHARRKFFDAKETDGRRAAQMLAMVGELYAVEQAAREKIEALANASANANAVAARVGASSVATSAHAASASALPIAPPSSHVTTPRASVVTQQANVPASEQDRIRLDLRQSQSKPILSKIKAWLDTAAGSSGTVLPRSPMAQAIQYMLNQWDALCVYASAGFLNIDNNAAERALKRIAIGRKNWLFAGNDEFGQVSATLSSLIASAQRHGLDPQAYLMSVLAKIAQTSLSELDQFLPDVWKTDLVAEAKRLKAEAEALKAKAAPSQPTPPAIRPR